MDIEKIESNWKTFEKLCKKLSDPNIDKMIDELGERIVMCPASPKKDQAGCFPGGLVQHSLDVALTMRSINDALNFGLSSTSILKVGLLHDLGKIGSKDKSYFIEQDSDWHREKLGQHYKFNDSLNKMSVSHRTLSLLQSFGIVLTTDEWLAIQLSQGSHFEENRFYVGHEPTLALALQQAKTCSIHKNRVS
tara:strand:- start:67 stop:642 length:576 start_codon:yes stop_codon:yes gene_type:complete